MTDFRASAEAAFAIAIARDVAVKALYDLSPNKESFRMAWLCGYGVGRLDGAREVFQMWNDKRAA